MKRLGAVAVVLMLAACGSGKAAKSTSPASSRTASASPVAPPSGATVKQWASFIATHQTPVLKADTEMAGCQYAVDPRQCILTGFTFTLTTETLSLQIKDAEAGELGQPPPELAQLVQSTIDSLDAVKAASDAQEKCGVKTDSACLQLDAALDNTHDDVIEVLNGWKPYTG